MSKYKFITHSTPSSDIDYDRIEEMGDKQALQHRIDRFMARHNSKIDRDYLS